ncbi:hypothetical protein [Bradyrhizobium lablabi]|uniref:hypothetical protein n=1 Tax=Bradyrhizobium lablabi TaxID=722472 RepID=UPI001BA8F12E|nr:hypothetical protein [Bradyrhizobium lablabi]MBR0695867.1 hypothetical protein [Bradyrhizobium lablabi]
MTTINELRTRARAIGYKSIRKRGSDYHLINTMGEAKAGASSLDTLTWLLSQFEETHATLEAGGVVVYSTACGIPQSAVDKNGDVALDDPRVVQILAEQAAAGLT